MTAERSRVLLVDDRKDNLLALEAVLEPLRFELLTASSGLEALHRLLEEEISAIVLDVQMPDMDGFETAALLKSRAATRHIPIVFLTAISHDVDHQLAGYEAGAVDYICKPFDPNVLRAKVRALVEMSAELRGLARANALYRQSVAAPKATVTELANWRRPAASSRATLFEITSDAAREEGAGAPFVELTRRVDLELGGDLTSPGVVRKHVREALAEQPEELCETVVLLVSELVTNAVVHARSSATVRLDIGPCQLRAEIADTDISAPSPRKTTPFDRYGRGLRLVSQLVDRCGWTRLAGGKMVWFEIDLDPGEGA